MKWKDWSSWLKGGIIGMCIGIFGIIIGSLLWIPYENDFLFLSGFSAPLVLSLWTACGPNNSCQNVGLGILFFILGNLIILLIYFLIGAVIGRLIGKIKSKK